jgi:hypothetical protein
MIHFVGISTVVCGGLNKFKMATIAMVTKVQNGRQIQKSSDLAEIWFPSRFTLNFSRFLWQWQPF